MRIFPSLASRPLLLTGESYAGTFIVSERPAFGGNIVDLLFIQPYIAKAIFSDTNPPVNLSRIAIGNGAMGAEPEYEELPMVGKGFTRHEKIS